MINKLAKVYPPQYFVQRSVNIIHGKAYNNQCLNDNFRNAKKQQLKSHTIREKNDKTKLNNNKVKLNLINFLAEFDKKIFCLAKLCFPSIALKMLNHCN